MSAIVAVFVVGLLNGIFFQLGRFRGHEEYRRKHETTTYSI